MANSYSANVIFCDTNATFTHAKNICGIKYMGGNTSSATVKSSNSVNIWAETAATNVFDEVEIRDEGGVSVVLTGTASVYLYLEV